MSWIDSFWAKHEIFLHRLCSNGKTVMRCNHDGRDVRFPCTACHKNKRGSRWADYKARDLILRTKHDIAEARTMVQGEDDEKRYKLYRMAAEFQSKLCDMLENDPDNPALTAWMNVIRETNNNTKDRENRREDAGEPR